MASSGQAPVLTGSQPDVPFLVPDHLGPVLPTDLSVAALVTSIVFALLAIASVALRFYAQRKSKTGIALDGILLIFALILATGLCILSTWAALCGGLGWPLLWLASPAGLRFQKAIDAGQILWGVAIATVRTSLLLFYRRIFTTRGFQHTTTAVMIINASWLLVFIIVTALTYSVNRTEQNSIDYPAWLIAIGCLDIILDLSVLCLPLFVIRKLNMSTGKKWGIAGMFWLGAFCVVVSIVRVVYFAQLARLPESDRQFGDITSKCMIWSTIQPCTSIVAACLPTYGPFLRLASGFSSRISTKLRSLLANRRTQDRSNDSKLIDSYSDMASDGRRSGTGRHANYGNYVAHMQTFEMGNGTHNTIVSQHE